jgi:hypothetical protein
MKATFSHSVKILLVVFCLFQKSHIYSQDNNSLFGKRSTTKSENPKNKIIRCSTVEYEHFLQDKDPHRMSNAQFEGWITPLLAKNKAMQSNAKTAETLIITIPVVVHVIHSGQNKGTAPNITDEQVLSQIKVLNQDFRKMVGTPGYNSNPVGADVEIQFELAKQDPNGNPTNGIDRVNSGQPSWSEIDIEATLKPATIWDPTLYLNIWTVKFTNNNILGYAQFPEPSGLQGIRSFAGTSLIDGVVSNYDVFGSIVDNNGTFLMNGTYNKGRTMSHEVGHFLGLLHIWGDGGGRNNNIKDCNATDYCEDTPPAGWENYDCPTTAYDSCPTNPGNDMVENYMDYTNDVCMNIFTQNQKDRMRTIINNAARRKSLKTSNKHLAIPLFENDAEVKIEASFPNLTCGAVANQTKQGITIINRGTTNLTSVTLNYKLNYSSTIMTYNWTGNLTTNDQNTFEININSTSSGFISVGVVSVNGVIDQRPENDTASRTFTIPLPTLNYANTNYVFRLQQDFSGSQTTWNLKDSSGMVVKSGGPYSDTNVPALITQNWTLSNNQCYTFTINDSSGDGICCRSNGNGYYDIKTNNNTTTVKSGGNFTSREITTFTIGTLGINSFAALNALYLYPNPANDIIHINVPNEYDLPKSLTINNSLGQIVDQKEVSSKTDLFLNTSSLRKGVYFITISKETESKTLQFIKK